MKPRGTGISGNLRLNCCAWSRFGKAFSEHLILCNQDGTPDVKDATVPRRHPFGWKSRLEDRVMERGAIEEERLFERDFFHVRRADMGLFEMESRPDMGQVKM